MRISATEIGNLFDWVFLPGEKYRKEEPHTFILERVFANFDTKSVSEQPVGFVLGLTSYRHLFERILPEGADGIYCVLEGRGACDTTLTYLINGPDAIFIGYDDLHKGMDDYEATIQLELYNTISENVCIHDLHIYPTPEFQTSHNTNRAA